MPETGHRLQHRWVRWLCLAVGWLCVFLGMVGLVLPLLPTTPFLLAAAACFARSSERFYRWLLANRTFGPVIRDWRTHRALTRQVKRKALFVTVLTFGVSIWIVGKPVLRLLLLCLLLLLLVFLLRLPTLADRLDQFGEGSPER